MKRKAFDNGTFAASLNKKEDRYFIYCKKCFMGNYCKDGFVFANGICNYFFTKDEITSLSNLVSLLQKEFAK